MTETTEGKETSSSLPKPNAKVKETAPEFPIANYLNNSFAEFGNPSEGYNEIRINPYELKEFLQMLKEQIDRIEARCMGGFQCSRQ